MRLEPDHQQAIRTLTREIFGDEARVWLFGSRVNDSKKGGDVDLLVESSHPVACPVELSLKLSAKISRLMFGRKIDVVVLAPNLQQLPIHHLAKMEGIEL